MAASLSSALSSLEVMLDSLMQRGGGGGDDKSKDHVPPALPVRPTARGRLPSLRRLGAAGDSQSPWNVGSDNPSALQLRANNTSQGRLAQEASQSLFNQDSTQEHENGKVSVTLEFERRALTAEAELKQKEEEIAALKQQLEHYDVRWSEYEIKMKSMEDKLKKQIASLQMSVAVATQNPAAAGGTPNYSELTSHCDEAGGMSAVRQQHTCDAADDKQSAVGHLTKEFRQQSQAFENGARMLVELRPGGQSGPSSNAIQDLKKLKSQFVAWKKEYKARLHQAKVELNKLVYLERGKSRRNWWSIKKMY